MVLHTRGVADSAGAQFRVSNTDDVSHSSASLLLLFCFFSCFFCSSVLFLLLFSSSLVLQFCYAEACRLIRSPFSSRLFVFLPFKATAGYSILGGRSADTEGGRRNGGNEKKECRKMGLRRRGEEEESLENFRREKAQCRQRASVRHRARFGVIG